ncbi:hypothetical protein [Mangrovibacterium lignilyticum]|uniref:hypothetical protein n=1 Tax=Mangrovibacterium lignilyticum TaxID=2668052 RepID=UPI0013D0D9FA|nr:hypothetical protein [Mangrovibacterium lignilyticum]
MTPEKKKRISQIVGTAVAVIVMVVLQQTVFKAPGFDKVLMQTAQEMNKNCPFMVDAETRLDNAVAAPGKRLEYNYTLINTDKDSIDIESFTDYLQPILVNNVKTHPDMASFRDNHIIMDYNYKDRNGIFITKISITPELYQE